MPYPLNFCLAKMLRTTPPLGHKHLNIENKHEFLNILGTLVQGY